MGTFGSLCPGVSSLHFFHKNLDNCILIQNNTFLTAYLENYYFSVLEKETFLYQNFLSFSSER